MAGRSVTLRKGIDLGEVQPDVFSELETFFKPERSISFTWRSRDDSVLPVFDISDDRIKQFLEIAAPLTSRMVEWAGHKNYRINASTAPLATGQVEFHPTGRWHTDTRDLNNSRRRMIASNQLPTQYLDGEVPVSHPILRALRERRSPHAAVEKALQNQEVAIDGATSTPSHATGMTLNTLHRAQPNPSDDNVQRTVFIISELPGSLESYT